MRMRWTFWILACAPALLWAQTTPTTVAVDWQPLGELLVPSTDRAAAEVLPRQRSQLAAETSARVAAVSVEVGQRVDADTLLVRLDGRDAELRVAATRAALQAAEASANLAQVRLDKARRLIENDYVSADEVKEREAILAGELATVAMRRSDLDLARRELSRAQLKAPFAGWVIERQAQVGQWVAPGSPLLTLVEDGPVEVSAQLDPVAASALRPDSHADYIDERGRRWPLRWLRAAPRCSSRVRGRPRCRQSRRSWVRNCARSRLIRPSPMCVYSVRSASSKRDRRCRSPSCSAALSRPGCGSAPSAD